MEQILSYVHVVCSRSRREERTGEVFFVESAIFDPIQSMRVWSSISNSLSQFRKDWINIINCYKIIMNVSILSPFYLSPLFALDSAILKILKNWLKIRNQQPQKPMYTNYNIYTLILFNFVRHIESAILNFENLTSDS